MLTHGKIWTAIDALASRYGLLPSGLAKRAGLDVTAFNLSNRVTTTGGTSTGPNIIAKAVDGGRKGSRSTFLP
jgi:phage repressor protein C with HTH and peptisase S24 domain